MKLTPNRRLAIYAKAVSLNDYVDTLYDQLVLKNPALPKRLSPYAQTLLWEKVIAASSLGETLFKYGDIARLAKEAFQWVKQWQLPIETLSIDYFNECAKAYEAACLENNSIDPVMMLDYLEKAILEHKIAVPSNMTFIGFEELNPQIQSWIKVLESRGTHIQYSSLLPYQNHSIHRFLAVDSELELQNAFLKAKQWLLASPNARIGIVVPDLEEKRAFIVRQLNEIFDDENQKTWVNLSAPRVFYHYPIIKSIFWGLRLLIQKSSLAEWRRFLNAPFFKGGLSEQNERALLDIALRKGNRSAFYSDYLLSFLQKAGFELPLTGEMLSALIDSREELRGKKSVDDWRETFLKLLAAFGWPGEMVLTPEEIDITKGIETLLEHYGSLDSLLGLHSYREAIGYLENIAQTTFFSPSVSETKAPGYKAPIQVLGVLEALGIPFDYLWVTGFYRGKWPQSPAPNPLLPIGLQVKYNVPRSSAARELKMAKQFTERLSEGANTVIFSYPLKVEEEPVSESTLISQYPMITASDLGLPLLEPAYPVILKREEDKKERIDPFPVLKTEKIKGGVAIFKTQALCPFKAFAEIRLQAKGLEEPVLGLNPAQRGEIIHAVLEGFFKTLPDQTALLALSEDALQATLLKTIESVLERWQMRYPEVLQPEYVRLEKKRLTQLMKAFIAIEKKRPYFKIMALEKKAEVSLGGITVSIRMDRVDETRDGKTILIDYKTGAVSIRDWFLERPLAPQLPLYCVQQQNTPVAGLLYGILRYDKVDYEGVFETKDFESKGVKLLEAVKVPGVASTFKAQTEHWQQALTEIASEFMSGVASVTPVEGDKTCGQCDLKPLCRVNMN